LKGTTNREPRVIENNMAGLENFRNHPLFQERCGTLRGMLGELL